MAGQCGKNQVRAAHPFILKPLHPIADTCGKFSHTFAPIAQSSHLRDVDGKRGGRWWPERQTPEIASALVFPWRLAMNP
jgi:hypothetical protein